MSELEIKTHDFEVAKKGLKEFSEQTTTDLDLKKVDTYKGVGEWFGEWFKGGGIGTDHKVTGAELNELTSQVQKHLIDINTMHRRFIQEFGQVYSALEALDKDYIQAILISIKATEETSKRIEVTQEQIKKIVDDQKKTLEVLKKFKQKLDNYAHLGDIDQMWNDCQKWYKEITTFSDSINNATSTGNANAKKIDGLKAALKTTDDKIADFGKCLNQQIAQIESVFAFTCELEKIIHLHDIDEMWSKTEVHSDRLDSLAQQSDNTIELVRVNQSHIDELSKYKEELCDIVHLNDVDELWDSNEVHSNQLFKLEKRSEETNNLIQNNKKLIDVAIADTVEKNDTAVQMLTKKIKYAYLLAGGTLGLALIELVIILLKVI